VTAAGHIVRPLIRKSFDALWPVRRRLADAFYSRFFELAPDARPLFDMERQQLKLMVDTAPRDAEWGERFFHLTDPDGHELSFAWPLR
jgi:hypothetical protein